MVKLMKDLMFDKYRLAGRKDVLILPPAMLVGGGDGNHYYDVSNIVKVYILTPDQPVAQAGSEQRSNPALVPAVVGTAEGNEPGRIEDAEDWQWRSQPKMY